MAAFSAGLANLARGQYPEGCWDEWYKGERGFAVTGFTTVAYGLAAILLDDGLDARDGDLLSRILKHAMRSCLKVARLRASPPPAPSPARPPGFGHLGRL
jgi:hypothetical protein